MRVGVRVKVRVKVRTRVRVRVRNRVCIHKRNICNIPKAWAKENVPGPGRWRCCMGVPAPTALTGRRFPVDVFLPQGTEPLRLQKRKQ